MSEVPEGWRKAPFFEAVTMPSGQVDPRDPQFKELPLIAPNHIESGTGRILLIESAESQGASSGKYTFLPGDVLYSKIRPYLKKATLADRQGLCSADMYPLRPLEGIDSGFILATVLSEDFTDFANSFSMRTGIPKVNRKELAQYNILLPPLPEQGKIAAILSSVDEAIEKTQAVIEQVQVVKRGLMQELLTKGMPGRHKRFKRTEIGEIPVDWELCSLKNLSLDTRYGTSVKCHPSPPGTPILRIPNVAKGKVDIGDMKYGVLNSAELARWRLCDGDLLFVRTNGNPDYVGRCAVFLDRPGEWAYASYLIRIRVRLDQVSPLFVWLACSDETTRSRLSGAIRTSAGNYNLNTQGLGALLIPIPPLDEQLQIIGVANSIDEREDAEQHKLKQLENLKKSLLSTLLTGEIRVPP